MGQGGDDSPDDGGVGSIFCLSAGECLAGRSQAPDYFEPFQGFIAQERNGRRGKATGIPGLKILNKGGGAEVASVWCAWAGNCTAGRDPHILISARHKIGDRRGMWTTSSLPV